MIEIKESATMTAQEFRAEIEAIKDRYFNQVGFHLSKGALGGLESLFVRMTFGKDKSEYPGGYLQNDPLNFNLFIDGLDRQTGDPTDRMSIEASQYSITTIPDNPYMAFGRVKMPYRKASGDAKTILKNIDKAMQRVAQAVKDNADDIQKAHRDLPFKVIDKVR